MVKRKEFPGELASARSARRFVTSALEGLDPNCIGALEVMVAELATNAIRHAGGPFLVTVEQIDGTIRVEVEDSGKGAPALRAPSPTHPSGRGLQIVAALSEEWGVIQEGRTKRVWFRVRG